MKRFLKNGGFMILPGMLGFLVFFIIPFVYTIYYSLTFGVMDQSFVWLENYKKLLSSKYFNIAFKNTMFFSITTVPITVFFAYMYAYIQNKLPTWVRFFNIALILPYFLPVSAVANVFNIILGYDSEFQAVIKNMLGASFPDAIFMKLPLYVFFIWKNLGISFIIFTAAIAAVPQSVIDASEVCGAGKFRKLYSIYVPLTSPSIIFSFIWTFVCSFKTYKELYLWYGAYPDEHMYMLQHYINNQFTKMNYQYLSTATVFFFVFIYIIISIMYFSERRISKNI